MRKMRKNYQRKLNKTIRAMNKNIANDDLWLGRFELRQKDAGFEYFSDGSGGILHVQIRAYDKKTGYYKDYILEYAPYLRNGWKLWEIANRFITEDAKVWEQNPGPRDKNFKRDYRNIKIPDKIMREENNYYLNYFYFKKEGV